jgi:hypothetical protein
MNTRVIVKPDVNACRCLQSMADEVFDSGKAAGLGLPESIERFTKIIAWETRTRSAAPPKAYLALCMAMFREAAAENATVYLPGYETILNKISLRDGRRTARRTLVVLRYAKEALGSVIFPIDVSRQPEFFPEVN